MTMVAFDEPLWIVSYNLEWLSKTNWGIGSSLLLSIRKWLDMKDMMIEGATANQDTKRLYVTFKKKEDAEMLLKVFPTAGQIDELPNDEPTIH